MKTPPTLHVVVWDHPDARAHRRPTLCGLRVKKEAIAKHLGPQYADICGACLEVLEAQERTKIDILED